MRSFSTAIIVPRTPADARLLALDKLGEPMRKSGYSLAEQTPTTLAFDRQSALRWPLSLLFPGSSRITMTFEGQADGRTRMVVAGTAPRRIAGELERLAG